MRRFREVIVPNGPDEPVPEVRVMANALTLIRFDASIDRASLELEGRTTRFRLVVELAVRVRCPARYARRSWFSPRRRFSFLRRAGA